MGDITRYFVSKLESTPRFQLIAQPTSLNVCFWYVPSWMNGSERNPKLAEVTAAIHKQLVASGDIMIDFAPVVASGERYPHFFRVIVSSPKLRESHIDYIVNEIARLGEKLSPTDFA